VEGGLLKEGLKGNIMGNELMEFGLVKTRKPLYDSE
jgi:hypothetical protein